MSETTVKTEPIEYPEPPVDVLTVGWLHKVMLFFHKPVEWPAWLVILVGFFPAVAVGILWQISAPTAVYPPLAGLFLALFFLIDLLILLALPRWGISFGPWQAQFIVLGVPRWLLATAVSVLPFWLEARFAWGIHLFFQLAVTAAYLRGLILEPQRLALSELMVFSDKLPLGSRPIRILHISDLHIERLSHREDQVIELAAAANPDLIVITGDYVNLSYNRDPETLESVVTLLQKLEAPHGVFATLGSPPVDLRETVAPLFAQLEIPLLRHEWRAVELDADRRLTLIGMDCTHHLPTDRAQLAQLVESAPANLPQLLLYHSPELMPEAVEHGLDLYLCGHTHGGQVRLPLIGPLLTSSQLGRQFVMGLYKYGRTHLYISRGIGLEGLSAPRVRFFCPPEMTLIHLAPLG